MKIFFPIGAFYPSQIGGPCNTLYWHTNELEKNNIKINIVTTTIGIKNGLVKKDIFYSSECGNVYYGEGGITRYKTILTALRKIADNDIIHLNSIFNFLTIIVFLYIRLFHRNKPIVFSPRGELNLEAMLINTWKKKPILFLYKQLYKGTLFHSTSDQETADICFHFQKGKVVQIPNFIKPFKRIQEVEVKKELLYVGRIHPIKAIHKIIRGLSMSKSFLNSEFKFVLVGNYEGRYEYYYDELCELIIEKNLQKKIEFKGHLTGYDKELIYAQSFATLLLSETENFGNVVVESLSQGTPVITSKGTPWSIVEEYGCGFHIDNTPLCIAETIDRFICKQKNEYELTRKNAIKLVEDKFNIEYQIHHWIREYNNIIQQRSIND